MRRLPDVAPGKAKLRITEDKPSDGAHEMLSQDLVDRIAVLKGHAKLNVVKETR